MIASIYQNHHQDILAPTMAETESVGGPEARTHLRFDDLYEAVQATVDELAERVRMLGGVPLHAPGQIERHSLIPASDSDRELSAAAMVKEALQSVEQIIGFMHEGIEVANQAGDPGSADLLTRFVQVHQKEAWFLRSMLA